MAISINVQGIKSAKARTLRAFSTVDITTQKDEWSDESLCLFLSGPGHEDAAARIAALINEQVVRRDTNTLNPVFENTINFHEALGDDGPTYDGPDDEHEALRMETEQNVSLGQAREAAEEQRAYEEEDRLGREAHLRSVRRDDKPWMPHEDEIEEDVRAGRRDADGEPF